ncbi:hypothetical protein T492DRAFT_595123 [Pavlovales sp. CCMP2436]|nr:hypothetical protein T492DRAFT_595123 [Pavlovales sp. CCMP2436]
MNGHSRVIHTRSQPGRVSVLDVGDQLLHAHPVECALATHVRPTRNPRAIHARSTRDHAKTRATTRKPHRPPLANAPRARCALYQDHGLTSRPHPPPSAPPAPAEDGETTVLPLGAGYGIVLGFGVFFSLFTSLLVYLDTKYAGTAMTSEHFNTAGRSVKTGLTASVIVSQWTWAATLLQSSNVAWAYGISGPFWYAAGATVQVLLFGILAIEIKVKAPTAHTFLELVNARWGKRAHIIFMIYGFITNMIVSAMLLLGGAAVINALTGMQTELASFLIPWGVVMYTFAGGLKATFLACYMNTAVIMGVLVYFVFLVYASSPLLGDSGVVYDKLAEIISYPSPTDAEKALGYHCGPVPGNRGGSYLTMLSSDGLMFGIINLIGNFGTVFMDQSYWQSAIAAKPSASHKGYMLGGLVWFSIPFTLATSLGLAANALGVKLTPSEAGQGLVPPAAAIALIGVPGAVLVVVMLFMAIVSTGSAECIAVSSIVVYDVYFTYINPKATGQQILFYSRVVIAFFGVVMGSLACILYAFGISLGWVYLFMGIVIGSGVIPVALCLGWRKTNGTAATFSVVTGSILALITWLVTCSSLNNGNISVNTLGQNEPMLAGNVVALLSSGVITVVWSLIFPENYDFESMKRIPTVEQIDEYVHDEDETPEKLMEAKAWITSWGWVVSIIIMILWPVACIPWGVFPKAIFALWTSIAMVWGLLAATVIIILPVAESWGDIMAVVNGMAGIPQEAKYKPQSVIARFA